MSSTRVRLAAILIATAALTTGSCDVIDGDLDDRANDVARAYLRAATERDTQRLCDLRTDAALQRWWGGRAACVRHAHGLAVDPVRVGAQEGRALDRKARAVKPRTARVVPDDTSVSESGDEARVVIDFGEAVIEDGHAVGGEILELDLQKQGGEYKVAHLGFAVHAD